MEADGRVFASERLREFTSRVFQHVGVPPRDADTAADVLAAADLRGIDSHGVARLRSYLELLEAGLLNPRPDIRVVRETASTATVDGDNGMGLVVGPRANEIAMDKAEAAGSGWVAARNSNHFGIAGYYPLRALERDLVGWAMTNSTKLVAPLWGAEPRLGTNPIAVAFPAGEEPPIVIDMATPVVPLGKIEIALRRGERIPLGWAVDRDGRPTEDPRAVVEGGALVPLGGDREHGGHKGYCLGLLVDLLCGPLSGANWGPFTPPFMLRQARPERSVGVGIGHFFGALRIDGFIEAAAFKRQVDDVVRTFRATPPVAGTSGPLLPGDPERAAEDDRRANGVPLDAAVLADLRDLSRHTGIALE
jgi:LDH2 family malate/lactate/ureidoglycolate dehydrogenase